MSVDADEDALSWAGETDPSHAAAPKAVVDAASAEAEAKRDSPPANSALLIVLGIFAGVYLLYAVGWGIHAFTHSVPVGGVFPVIMYEFGEFLSIISPLLWACAVWLLVKASVWRVLWLAIGVLVLAPWPFIVGG